MKLRSLAKNLSQKHARLLAFSKTLLPRPQSTAGLRACAGWVLRTLCLFVPLQRTVSRYREEAEQTSCALRRAERSVVEKELQVDELQRLLAGMEKVPAL